MIMNAMCVENVTNSIFYRIVLRMEQIMKQTENNNASMSLSKQRKLQRAKDLKKHKKDAALGKLVGIIVSVAVIVGLLALFGAGIFRMVTKVTADSNYSAQLNDDGTIKGVTASDYVALCDYKDITIAYKDIEYTDEQIAKDIEALLEEHAELSKDSGAAAKDGDKVNIDYVGTIDGVAFEGGNTQGKGADLTIGTNSSIDDFEQQLIGHVAGDSFDINVTFPDEYPNNPDLAGKDAVFSVVLNGIYTTPEFNDKFVLKYLGDFALTADGYKAYLKETNEDSNLTAKVREYLNANSEVSKYPKAYLNQVKALKKFEDLAYFQSVNDYYAEILGGPLYPNFSSYIDMTEGQYDRTLVATGKTIVKQNLIFQAIAEKEGIVADEATYLAYMLEQGETEDSFNTELQNYGKGYLMQAHIGLQVLDLVKQNVTIQK